ncbi:hypothetical protein Pan216_40500 [Planctomycetes bacterium Pan216]|uniref:Uncharacterized protein n=1 Tax=Kolteria novifilia TaxID=2527975 RepID=A0A518B866_9BACT|nr:hypothetical protein Pan216_40500 [Planctomycetes bacterium Pan216]
MSAAHLADEGWGRGMLGQPIRLAPELHVRSRARNHDQRIEVVQPTANNIKDGAGAMHPIALLLLIMLGTLGLTALAGLACRSLYEVPVWRRRAPLP